MFSPRFSRRKMFLWFRLTFSPARSSSGSVNKCRSVWSGVDDAFKTSTKLSSAKSLVWSQLAQALGADTCWRNPCTKTPLRKNFLIHVASKENSLLIREVEAKKKLSTGYLVFGKRFSKLSNPKSPSADCFACQQPNFNRNLPALSPSRCRQRLPKIYA